jgi:hypothetical protein
VDPGAARIEIDDGPVLELTAGDCLREGFKKARK